MYKWVVFVEEGGGARKEKRKGGNERKGKEKRKSEKKEKKGKGKERDKEEEVQRFLPQFIGVLSVRTRWTKE